MEKSSALLICVAKQANILEDHANYIWIRVNTARDDHSLQDFFVKH